MFHWLIAQSSSPGDTAVMLVFLSAAVVNGS
jgi:hypothetical protein